MVGTETEERIKAEVVPVTKRPEWAFRLLITYISTGCRSPTNPAHEVASAPNEYQPHPPTTGTAVSLRCKPVRNVTNRG